MKSQITHLENPDDSLLHENIMRISGIGMNESYFKSNINLEIEMEKFSKIAEKLNKHDDEAKNKLKQKLKNYFMELI